MLFYEVGRLRRAGDKKVRMWTYESALFSTKKRKDKKQNHKSHITFAGNEYSALLSLYLSET